MITMPRSIAILMGLFVGLIVIPLAHGVLPWALSTRLPRHGWAEGSPGYWNWIRPDRGRTRDCTIRLDSCFRHPQAPPAKVKLGLTPSFLMMRGPYRLTRNPMYVAELGLWLGLTIYFGSLGVLLGFLVLWSVVKFIILPREERSLEREFGQTYLEYKNRVPRWFWKTK